MGQKSVYQRIKKQNGESFAQAIRKYDNGIFDIPGIVDIVKYAGRCAAPILAYLESLKGIHIEPCAVHQNPFALLKAAGYDAYYADTLEKQNAIEPYYFPKERLCTFNDRSRFKDYYIINAVRQNVDEIKRDFFWGREERDDEYGTSVLSIQIKKDGSKISIKNRYNHSVPACDNTLGSNPDNIIRGLSDALSHHFHVDFSSKIPSLPEEFFLVNGKIFHHNYKAFNIYFGPDFYCKKGQIYTLDKDKEVMLDECILNVHEKTLYHPVYCSKPIPIDEVDENQNSLLVVLATELKGKKLKITKNAKGEHNILADGNLIATESGGKIKALNLLTTQKIGSSFLAHNSILESFTAPNVEIIGDDFLFRNTRLSAFYAPKLTHVGDDFLHHNTFLSEFDAPRLTYIGDDFLVSNLFLKSFKAPLLKEVGGCFLYNNLFLEDCSIPQIESVGDSFLYHNTALSQLKVPELQMIGSFFLFENTQLTELDLPKVESIDSWFLFHNTNLKTLNAPSLIYVASSFLSYNLQLSRMNVPQLKIIEEGFLRANTHLQELDLPQVERIGSYFLADNLILHRLNAPHLKKAGDSFLKSNQGLQILVLPEMESAGKDFLRGNHALKILEATCLTDLGQGSFGENTNFNTNAPVLVPLISSDRVLPPDFSLLLRKKNSRQIS